jgi:predicted dehydrogenase
MTLTSLPDGPAALPDAPTARRIVVLGLGRVGLEYAMAASRLHGCALAGLVEPRGDLRRFARGAGFTVPSAASLDVLLAKVAADAVVIAAPPAERLAAIEAASAAGLAVMVDGLPVLHAEGAARLEPVLARARAPIGCSVGALFHPLFARAAQVLAGGALGAMREVRASVYVSRVFAAGAPPERGDVLDFAVGELLALLDALFGPAQGVAATGQRLYGARLDEVHARLLLAGGVEAGVDGSWSVPGYPRASLVVEVVGERGALLVSDDALEAELPAPCAGLEEGHTRRVLADEPDEIAFEGGEPSRALLAFGGALSGGALPEALDPHRALRAARALDALRRSLADSGSTIGIAS